MSITGRFLSCLFICFISNTLAYPFLDKHTLAKDSHNSMANYKNENSVAHSEQLNTRSDCHLVCPKPNKCRPQHAAYIKYAAFGAIITAVVTLIFATIGFSAIQRIRKRIINPREERLQRIIEQNPTLLHNHNTSEIDRKNLSRFISQISTAMNESNTTIPHAGMPSIQFFFRLIFFLCK